MQIALYTDLLRRLGSSARDYGYVWDAHGVETRYDLHSPLTRDPADTLWRDACRAEIERRDDLTLLPKLGRSRRDALVSRFPRVSPTMLRRFQARARLHLAGSAARPYLTAPIDHVPRRHVEVFFDIEDDPLRDLVYLHGFVVRERANSAAERYVAFWAEEPTEAGERDAFAAAWAFLREHRESLIVCYSKHERTR